MTSPLSPTDSSFDQTSLVAMIMHHRDDVAINHKAEGMDLDDRALFPILVAIARLVAKADAASNEATPQPL